MVRNKDRWSALSMGDRAALIDIYVKSGITDLGEIRRNYNGIPYKDFNTSNYDYFNASPEMTPTKEGQHWDSRNPHTGRLLKREDHPTFDLLLEGEKQAGYKIIRGYNSELYSVPDEPTNYVEDYNNFGGGGPIGAGQATYNHPRYNHKEEAAMYSYLRSRGVPHTQASAIMGNIAVESMLNPEITQIGGGGGYGLIQATDRSRKKAFINYDGQPYEFGSDISPETQRQLDYIVDKGLNTFTSGEWRGNRNISKARTARNRFLTTENINTASKIFTENYLRPGKPHYQRRRSMSNYFNDNYNQVEKSLEGYEKAFLFRNTFEEGGEKIPYTFNNFGSTLEISKEVPKVQGEFDVPLPLRLESQKDEEIVTMANTPLTYKVQSGDSLSKIAKAKNTSIESLTSLNPQLLERKGGINTIFVGEELNLDKSTNNVGINKEEEDKFVFTPIVEQERISKDYSEVPVSLLYKQTTGENWPPKSGIYADMYDGSRENNLEIKKLLVDENNRKDIFKVTYDGKIKNLNSSQHVGMVKTENIENPSGIDYSSPDSVPVYHKNKVPTTNLNKAFTFESMDDFSTQFVCDKECASTLTNRLMSTKNYDLIDKYNYRGSAWTMLQNAEKQGVPIINIYDELQNKDLTKQQVIEFAHKKSKDINFQNQILEGLSAGNVVTLMNPDSTKFDIAKEESQGRVLSTHAGVIVDVGGKKYVAHSMGGTRKLTPVESLLQGKNMVITGIARYDKKESEQKDNYQTADLSAYGFNLQEDLLRRTDRISSISAYRAERSLHNNAEALKKNLYVTDEALQFTSEILPALMYRETNSGYLSSDTYRKTSAQSTATQDVIRNIREATTGVSESIGLTNVKLKDENKFFTPRDFNKLGLEGKLTREQKESPELTGVLTAVSMDRRMKKLDKLLGEHKKEVPKDVYKALLIMSWSQGFENIETNIKRFIENGDLKELSQYKTFNDYTSIVQYLKYLGKEI